MRAEAICIRVVFSLNFHNRLFRSPCHNLFKGSSPYSRFSLFQNQEELNTVNMATCNAGGLKVSGKCVIRLQLTEKAGKNSYSVKISPGGHEVKEFSDGGTETEPCKYFFLAWTRLTCTLYITVTFSVSFIR